MFVLQRELLERGIFCNHFVKKNGKSWSELKRLCPFLSAIHMQKMDSYSLWLSLSLHTVIQLYFTKNHGYIRVTNTPNNIGILSHSNIHLCTFIWFRMGRRVYVHISRLIISIITETINTIIRLI